MSKTKRNIIIAVVSVVVAIGITLAIVLPLTLNNEQTYAVKFDSNGGSAVNSITDVKRGSLIAKPVNPVKLNHTFEGWYKTATLKDEWKFESDKVYSDITLYAKWTYNETVGLNLMLNGDEYTIAGLGNVTEENIVLPESYNGKPVTTIAESAFAELSSVKTVYVPASVTTIKSKAFYKCSNLTAVALPEQLTVIEDELFYGCSKLADVNFPAELTSIGNNAFSECASLTEVELPAKLNSLGEKAFSACRGIEKLTVAWGNSKYVSALNGREYNCVIEIMSKDGVTVHKVVVGCKSSEIPATGHSVIIGKGAFCGCGTLESISIPFGVTEIEDEAFQGCSSLKEVNLPASVTRVGDYAFSSCSALTTVTFAKTTDSTDDNPEYGIKELGKEAFSYCYELKSLNLHASLNRIGRGLLYNSSPSTIVYGQTANNLREIIVKYDPNSEEEDSYTKPLNVICFDSTGSDGVPIYGLA